MVQTAPLPYYPASRFYRIKCGQRVYKIPLTLVNECPLTEQHCIFCDKQGSAAYEEQVNLNIAEQIALARHKMATAGRTAPGFLIYFQSYTSTLAQLDTINDAIKVAMAYPEMRGLIIATRPDCLRDEVLELLTSYAKKCFVGIELGVQSFADTQLVFLQRGHTVRDSMEAIERITKYKDISIGIHLILGLPSESYDDIIGTARFASTLPIDNIKLHNLHIIRGTPLAALYQSSQFSPIDLPEYAKRVILFLQHLSPNIAIQRLAAIAPRHSELIAPLWTKEKMRVYQYILDRLRTQQAYQGQLYKKIYNTKISNQ
jgi:radical SAM protein (TIGR01212 family)